MKDIHVVVAIVFNQAEQILITQRPMHKPQGGIWEFPGGKVEPGEALKAALVREIKEEVGLDILSADFLGEVPGEASVHHTLTLHVFCVKDWRGEALCCEDQLDLAWVPRERLGEIHFPQANQAIVDMITCSGSDGYRGVARKEGSRRAQLASTVGHLQRQDHETLI